MTTTTKYKFDSTPVYSSRGGGGGAGGGGTINLKQHRRHGSEQSSSEFDPTDGSGSLTYSATSSINSAAGESTDSNHFAEMLRGLDVSSEELAHVLAKERRRDTGERSIAGESLVYSVNSAMGGTMMGAANSLAYSEDGADTHIKSYATDGESRLHGTDFMSTITGQPSDQFGYDGGGGGYPPQNHQTAQHHHQQQSGDNNFRQDDSLDLLFAPAEHADSLKRRKELKKQKKLQQTLQESQAAASSSNPSDAVNATPRVKNGNISSLPESRQETPPPSQHGHHATSAVANNTYSGSALPPSSPQRRRPPNYPTSLQNDADEYYSSADLPEEEDVWYGKWWMFCFPDTVKNVSPKR